MSLGYTATVSDADVVGEPVQQRSGEALRAEDLADDNEYQGRCLHCRQAITAKG